ncbi:hypothetical protein F7734_53570 [Scytonema sp. UIC 10036]|uniref:hypothetical protein n=1 Tax=Scytonema sp. UIC 10036 TaxID=2304196 RepID=UPI0012DA1F01|nr:hypothetical protein [Scytonema sp. UIC 10036]MUH00638.1 hypothetical protein [Scytonema sp. UIC 10036]
MAQTRIVLDPKYKPKAEAILEQTGISTLSQLFTLLLVNYGDNLVNALKPQAMTMQAPLAPVPTTQQLPNELPKIQPRQPAQVRQFAPMSL